MVEHGFQSLSKDAAAKRCKAADGCCKKPVWGGEYHVKHHETKKQKSGVTACSTVEKESRYVNLASQVHILSNHQ